MAGDEVSGYREPSAIISARDHLDTRLADAYRLFDADRARVTDLASSLRASLAMLEAQQRETGGIYREGEERRWAAHEQAHRAAAAQASLDRAEMLHAIEAIRAAVDRAAEASRAELEHRRADIEQLRADLLSDRAALITREVFDARLAAVAERHEQQTAEVAALVSSSVTQLRELADRNKTQIEGLRDTVRQTIVAASAREKADAGYTGRSQWRVMMWIAVASVVVSLAVLLIGLLPHG